MLYTWECRACGHRLMVSRSVKDYRVPPHGEEAMHPRCSRVQFKRIITGPAMVLVHENEDQYWNDDNYRE